MLPTLIVIGAMKCATSSLHYYLGLHPEISMTREKELNFFVAELNWERGLAWYESQFAGKATHCGESSPSYTGYPRFAAVPARMHAVVPDAKLIYVVRDPVARMVSHYVHLVAAGTETRALEDALRAKQPNDYLSRSMYHMQLEQFLTFYPTSQILVICAEELRDRRAETLREVFRFLDVDDSFTSRGFSSTRHRSSLKRRRSATADRIAAVWRRGPLMRLPRALRWNAEWVTTYPFSRAMEQPAVPEHLRHELAQLVEEDVRRLRESTGQEFDGWCV